MASLLDMNREEREEYVTRLYKEGRTVIQIAELVHMSFRDISAITHKVKLQSARERGLLEEDDDIKTKSKITQAIKLFSEGKTTVEVVIALDLAADHVRAIYREFWELKHMDELSQIYDKAKDCLHSLLRLHKIVQELGMGEHDIRNVFELAKYDELRNLQWKVEYLKNELDILANEKWKSTNHILKLNRMIDEFQSSLPRNGGWYDNTDNLYPTYTEPDTRSYSIQVSYKDYWQRR